MDSQGVNGTLPLASVNKYLLLLTMILSTFLVKKSHPRIHSNGGSKFEQTKKVQRIGGSDMHPGVTISTALF